MSNSKPTKENLNFPFETSFLGDYMKFQKQFSKEDFLNALSKADWQKTREIADKVGCKNKLVTDTLLNTYSIVLVGTLEQYNVYNAVEIVEWRWTSGGKQGTREWRLKEK